MSGRTSSHHLCSHFTMSTFFGLPRLNSSYLVTMIISELMHSNCSGSAFLFICLCCCCCCVASVVSNSVWPHRQQPTRRHRPGILQARTLEWVAISSSNAWKRKVKVKSLSRVRLLATPWTAAYQASLSMGFSRQEYWSGVPLPSPQLPYHM